MKKVRFAIIGCGRIARRHAEQINKYGDLVAVCDVVRNKADALGSEFDATAFYNIDDMLASGAEIDVISICTPNGVHAAQAIKCLKAGMHVLCEKPMAITVNDCGEMIKAAEKANKRLFAIKQNRFNPPVAAVKQAIDEGRLGKLFSFQLSCFWNRREDYYKDSWKGTQDLDGGTLFTQFSHFIDLLYWIIGDVKSVHAYVSNYAHKGMIEFEDTGVVILEFYNGVIGTINYTVNSYEKNMEGSLTLFGEKGTVKLEANT
jgi:UDP-N-acetyl-2-amino-2-deoxyglucuronate dehydrogenase